MKNSRRKLEAQICWHCRNWFTFTLEGVDPGSNCYVCPNCGKNNVVTAKPNRQPWRLGVNLPTFKDAGGAVAVLAVFLACWRLLGFSGKLQTRILTTGGWPTWMYELYRLTSTFYLLIVVVGVAAFLAFAVLLFMSSADFSRNFSERLKTSSPMLEKFFSYARISVCLLILGSLWFWASSWLPDKSNVRNAVMEEEIKEGLNATGVTNLSTQDELLLRDIARESYK